MDKWSYEWTNRQINGWIDGWMNKQMNGELNRHFHSLSWCHSLKTMLLNFSSFFSFSDPHALVADAQCCPSSICTLLYTCLILFYKKWNAKFYVKKLLNWLILYGCWTPVGFFYRCVKLYNLNSAGLIKEIRNKEWRIFCQKFFIIIGTIFSEWI